MATEVNVKIIIAAHKMCETAKGDIYLPLHVGAAQKADIGFARDDTGDNISSLNPYFCELTGLYWAWKNLDAEYIGLVHYRRYFSGKKGSKDNLISRAITKEELCPLLLRYRVLVPKKRRYYIETLKSHYAHTHDAAHLDICRDVIEEKCPEYLSSYDKVLSGRSGYMFNMMIMEQSLLCEYCRWLFGILFDLSERIGYEGMNAFEARYPGRVSEILLNVWLEEKATEQVLGRKDIKELPYVEDVKWSQKIKGFLNAKLRGRKYGKSTDARH